MYGQEAGSRDVIPRNIIRPVYERSHLRLLDIADLRTGCRRFARMGGDLCLMENWL